MIFYGLFLMLRNVKLRSLPVGIPFDKFSSLASKVPQSFYIKPDQQVDK